MAARHQTHKHSRQQTDHGEMRERLTPRQRWRTRARGVPLSGRAPTASAARTGTPAPSAPGPATRASLNRHTSALRTRALQHTFHECARTRLRSQDHIRFGAPTQRNHIRPFPPLVRRLDGRETAVRSTCSHLHVLQRQVFAGAAAVRLELGHDAHDGGEDAEDGRHGRVDRDAQVVTAETMRTRGLG